MIEIMVRLQLNIFLCTLAANRNKGGTVFPRLQLSVVVLGHEVVTHQMRVADPDVPDASL